MIMAYLNYIAALILGVGVFLVLPVTHAAKPPKPVDDLEMRVTELEGDVAALDSEVAGLSGQVTQNTADIANIQANPPVAPRPLIIDTNGIVIGIVQDLLTDDAWASDIDLGTAALIWVQVAGEYLPLVAHRDFIRAHQTIYFEGTNCTGNAWINAGSTLPKPNLRLVDYLQYGVTEDGSVLKADFTQTATIATASQIKVSRSGSDEVWQRICVNQPWAALNYPMLPIGPLPPSTPPYRIEIR
jgi:hypothetical protein